MATRLTPGGLGWRKGSNPTASAAPRLPSATAPATPSPNSWTSESTPGAELDHTEALERWASTAPERPAWMRDPELLDGQADQRVPAHEAEASLRAFAPATPVAPHLAVDAPDTPAFDDATDRFAQFALRAAETQSLFRRDDDPFSSHVGTTAAVPGLTPFVTASLTDGTPGDVTPVAKPANAGSTSGWRPDDVQVSAADMDADAMRLEMLAARASETRERHGDFALPASGLPFSGASPATNLPENAAAVAASGWRRDTVAVSPEEFDADAARLELLASRAAEYRAPALEPEPVAEVDPDERVAFWRKDAAVVTAEEFDADAARLESLAARGPLSNSFSGEAAPVASESTPFWEQQERARLEAEDQAAAAAAARDAAANDEWHSRWERVAEEAARRGDTPDPLGL